MIPLFLPAASEFVKQLVPAAGLRYSDGGHFVLDGYADAIAEAVIQSFYRADQQRGLIRSSAN